MPKQVLEPCGQTVASGGASGRPTSPMAKPGFHGTIPLLEGALAVLTGLHAGQSVGPVFSVTMEGLKQAWGRVRDRARLGDLHFHDLRHEAISRLCEMGLTLPEVALISGHKDPRMLFRYVNLRTAELASMLKGRKWQAA